MLVLEEAAPGGQINFSPLVENYPGLPGVSGLQLSEALTRQAEEQGWSWTMPRCWASARRRGALPWRPTAAPSTAAPLILAPGTRHRPLGLEGEEALTGQGVSYCAVCDGPFYQGRDTAIVGGGDTALQEALFLSGVCRRVTLIHRRLEFRGSPKLAERVRTRDNIRLLLGYTPQALLQAEGRLTGLRVRQASTGQTLELPLDGVFAAVGRVPGTAPFRAQLELDEEGYFRSGEDCRTRLPRRLCGRGLPGQGGAPAGHRRGRRCGGRPGRRPVRRGRTRLNLHPPKHRSPSPPETPAGKEISFLIL